MAKVWGKKRPIFVLSTFVSICIIVTAGYYFNKQKYNIGLFMNCINKSDEECYKVYSDIFNEESAPFRKRKLALLKIIDLGKTSIPLVIAELNTNEPSFEKKTLLINAIANIDPNLYCDILAGPPYSEITITDQMAKRVLAVSILKKASISSEQRDQILKLIESFGADYQSRYEDYKKFCKSQK